MQSLLKWPKDVLGEVLYWCNLYDLIRLSCTSRMMRSVLDNLSRYWWERYFIKYDKCNATALNRMGQKWNICEELWIASRVLHNVPSAETPYLFFDVLNNLHNSTMVRNYIMWNKTQEFVCFRLLQTQDAPRLWKYYGDQALMFQVLVKSRVSSEAMYLWKSRDAVLDCDGTCPTVEVLEYYLAHFAPSDIQLCWKILLNAEFFPLDFLTVCEQALRTWACSSNPNEIANRLVYRFISFGRRDNGDYSTFVNKVYDIFAQAGAVDSIFQVLSNLNKIPNIRNTTGFNQLLTAFSAGRATDGT